MPLTSDQAVAINAEAEFHPFVGGIEIGGVWVFANAHTKHGLQISILLDNAKAPLLVNDRMVPVQIEIIGGTPLYVVDEHGEEDYPQLMSEIASVIDEARAG